MADTETGELEAAPVVMSEPIQAAEPVTRKRGGLGVATGLALGGAIAAGLGYGAAQYVPGGWPLQDTSALQAALTAQQSETESRRRSLLIFRQNLRLTRHWKRGLQR